MKVNNKEFDRFSKQIVLKKIGISGQKKINSAKVLVIGLGGLGCPLILYLANSGVGNIGIADFDKVELSNLNRQIIYTPKDVGKYKVLQTKKLINKINKKIKVFTFKKEINEKNIKKIINKFDIICDGTDNFKTRFIINDYCLKNSKKLISAAINKFDGQIFNFNFKKKIPCYRCFVSEIPSRQTNCDTDGILPAVAGIAGTLQANEVIKTIVGHDELKGEMLIFNSMSLEFRKIKLSKDSECVNKCSRK